MTSDEFISEIAIIAGKGFNNTQWNALRALFEQVRDQTAFEIADGVDKKRKALEKERVSDSSGN